MNFYDLPVGTDHSETEIAPESGLFAENQFVFDGFRGLFAVQIVGDVGIVQIENHREINLATKVSKYYNTYKYV